MRRFLRKARSLIICLAAVACIVVAFLLTQSPIFSGAERYTFSVGTSSGRQFLSDDPVLDKLLISHIGGESAVYAGDERARLENEFRARLLFTEEVCGTVNYYYYSPLLGGTIEIGGYSVNLHIAVGKESTAVGSPIIFGGY